MLRETLVSFESYDQWRVWARANRWIFEAPRIAAVVERIKRNGLIDPFYGWIAPSEINIEGTNYRETIVARRANARMRAELHLIVDIVLEKGRQIDVYAPESLTPFAARLRELFPCFVGSEYLPNAEARLRISAQHKNVSHQDVQELSFADRSFDLYISNEILEHVPSIERALKESLRVLKPGGYLISTFPFRYLHETGLEKARLVDSRIEYLAEAEYHGNPVDPAKGSLVFTIPAWDILTASTKVGFASAEMLFVTSPRHGVTGSELGGIFVMMARA